MWHCLTSSVRSKERLLSFSDFIFFSLDTIIQLLIPQPHLGISDFLVKVCKGWPQAWDISLGNITESVKWHLPLLQVSLPLLFLGNEPYSSKWSNFNQSINQTSSFGMKIGKLHYPLWHKCVWMCAHGCIEVVHRHK